MNWEFLIEIAFKLLAVMLLVFLNGFFVATEFALVKVRATQLEPFATRGHKRAKMALHLARNLDAYLSACQLGITLASLGLGWIGEPVSHQQFGDLDQELFVEVMKTNVFGPLKLSEAFVENIAASQQKKIIGMTSGLGSLTIMARMSRFYFYQMSKSALNMGMRAMRNDLQGRGIIVAILAPGMVDTDMLVVSGYKGEKLTPAASAAALYKLVAALTIDDKGLPVNVDGKTIPW